MDNSVTFKTMNAETALTRLKRKIPYDWDLNIYRGCQHGCKYCYAIYSHKHIGSGSYMKPMREKLK